MNIIYRIYKNTLEVSGRKGADMTDKAWEKGIGYDAEAIKETEDREEAIAFFKNYNLAPIQRSENGGIETVCYEAIELVERDEDCEDSISFATSFDR